MAAVRLIRLVRSVLIVFLLIFIGAQFVRPDRRNPPAPAAASLRSVAPPPITAILDRACRDCHSNETRWPWYTTVSPTSWLVANHVHEGRENFNYSDWTAYPSDDQDKFLGGMCDLARRGRMPPPSYLLIHRDARLSAADVTALCTWSDQMRDTLQ